VQETRALVQVIVLVVNNKKSTLTNLGSKSPLVDDKEQEGWGNRCGKQTETRETG
jgi:hypothetical protein